MKIKFIFAWYDFWIGAYYDRNKGVVYIFPLPMFGVSIKLRPSKQEIQETIEKQNTIVEETKRIYEEREKLLSIYRNLPNSITVKELTLLIQPGEQMSIYQHKDRNGKGDYFLLERDNGSFHQKLLSEREIGNREEFKNLWNSLLK